MQREIRLYVVVNALGFALLALASPLGCSRRSTRAGRGMPRSSRSHQPTLALTGIINWDLLSVALVAAALWAWAAGRPVLTGVLIGLGAATKLYPLFLLGRVAGDLPA